MFACTKICYKMVCYTLYFGSVICQKSIFKDFSEKESQLTTKNKYVLCLKETNGNIPFIEQVFYSDSGEMLIKQPCAQPKSA